MNSMARFGLLAVLLCASAAWSETVTIYRDGFGIPHIFAETEAGCAYGMGYAQGEDRLEGLLQNYLRAEGRMAEVFGESHYANDLKARMFRHYAKSEEHYMEKSPKIRAITEAYVAGLQRFMEEHPERVPEWAPEVTPHHITAVGRLLIWGWPEGEAAGDLRRGGIPYAPDREYRGSNQWLVAPKRSALGVPIALIDPHLSWYGLFRFYEARYYGGELAYSGMAVPGLPLATLGHSEFCSVAMTTGGPDTADIYYFPVNPENELQYRYDGTWRDMEVIGETIGVKSGDSVEERDVEFHYTHLGPVVARRDGNAYVMAFPYWEEIYHLDQVYAMNTARNIRDMRRAFRMRQYMAQNIMVGTVDGDILYLRNGRVPIRPAGYDFTRPVPGEDPASAWKGIHEIGDLVQVLNPRQGYMQNCNISPLLMMHDSPMRPERYPEYIYGPERTRPHQRAAMTLHQLHTNPRVTLEDAFEYAMSTRVYGADRWKARLEAAAKGRLLGSGAGTLLQYIRVWDEHSRADSTGATAYKYWKQVIWDALLTDDEQLEDRLDGPPPARLTDDELVNALETAARNLLDDYGSLTVPYGAIHRVGRRHEDGSFGRSYPVGGGNPGYGMATPRAIGFTRADDGKYIGQSGQTSTQVVVLSKPPRSWTYLPLGASDLPDSPHYDDQAERLFSPGEMKPTYFMDREGLMKNVTSTTELVF